MIAIASELNKIKALVDAGDLVMAQTLLESVVEISPRNVDVLNMLGMIGLMRGDYPDAIQWLQQAVGVNSGIASLQFNLGLAYARAGSPGEAAVCLRESIRIDSSYEPAHSLLCHVARELFRLDEAIEAGLAAIRLDPASSKSHTNLGAAYEAWGNPDLAQKHYKLAVELAPDQVQAQFNLATSYLGSGDRKAAVECLKKTLNLRPQHTGAMRQLARLTKYSSARHEDFSRYENLLESNTLNDNERSELLFALGKMYQDCGLYDDAFSCFTDGNNIQHERLGFRIDEFESKVSNLCAFYSREQLVWHTDLGNKSEEPLFIVGMPRSGTSLVEQILASHPNIFGAGELSWFWWLESIISDYLCASERYPECIRELDLNNSEKLCNQYLKYIHLLGDNKQYKYISDKNPGNFERLGLIWQLFPNAKVIHCRRDPLDTCISIYTLLFPDKIPYGYDLYTLGSYYRQYERLMRHWRDIMPDNLFTITYESLVEDPVSTVSGLIQFLGVPWDNRLMRFYENKRHTRTASDFQVRRPLYSDAIGRWKKYGAYLGPLHSGLKSSY